MDIQVDANEVIAELTTRLADAMRENAILTAQVKAHQRRWAERPADPDGSPDGTEA